jgi:hypothetical protein
MAACTASHKHPLDHRVLTGLLVQKGCRQCGRAWHARRCVPVRQKVHSEVQELAGRKNSCQGQGKSERQRQVRSSNLAIVSRVCQASAPWPGLRGGPTVYTHVKM